MTLSSKINFFKVTSEWLICTDDILLRHRVNIPQRFQDESMRKLNFDFYVVALISTSESTNNFYVCE